MERQDMHPDDFSLNRTREIGEGDESRLIDPSRPELSGIHDRSRIAH